MRFGDTVAQRFVGNSMSALTMTATGEAIKEYLYGWY